MRALVTNDDGINAPGIRVLSGVASGLDWDVLAAAPQHEHSGTSASLSALEPGGRLAFHTAEWTELPDVRVLGVRGSPAFITIMVAQGVFGPVPDVVLSGINHGPNYGYATLHSGTVGAALTAAGFGVPAMAVSCAGMDPEHWETAAEVSRQAATWLTEHGRAGTVLNVNVPDVPLDKLRGLRSARLAQFGAVQFEVTESADDYMTLTFSDPMAEYEPGTDAALLDEGWATATVLRSPCQVTDVDVAPLEWQA
ncbi:MAG TPA: 5'/3'-nucleotidase SurE [Jiangellaceae bacterium]|nr:5'/3'-nucleotidase SurE [Jiangellaceae bacterium]